MTFEDVVDINLRMVEAAGEPFGVSDELRLKGALTRPIDEYEYGAVDDVLTLAVMTMIAVGNGHGFIQGNKRTAFVSGRLFLLRHGYDLRSDVEAEAAPAPYDDDPMIAHLLIYALQEKPVKGPMFEELRDYLAAYVIEIDPSADI